MTLQSGSIRRRLTLGAALAITLAITVSWLGLTILFDRQVTRLAAQELEARSNVILAGFEPDRPLTEPPKTLGGDPRYLSPYSGQYWQIEIASRRYHSQSLWDTELAVREQPPPRGRFALYEAEGPDEQRLLVLDRLLQVGPQAVPLRISVATSRANLDEARSYFERGVIPFLVALGAMLITGSAMQVGLGLRPLAQVHHRIAELTAGTRRRLGQDMPDEVRPLATEIDNLLDDRDARIERARRRAADLAHTLKTPLQALLGETRRLRDGGNGGAADEIDQIADSICSSVEHELGRSRIRGEGRANLGQVAGNVAKVLRRTSRGDDIELRVDIADDLFARIDAHDLTEALGALAENAMRHARNRVVIRAARRGDRIDLGVQDDGPGVAEAQLSRIMKRGETSADTAEAHGVGLALAHEIALAADGTLRLENLAGGFLVTLSLKAG
ncbi:sensor histidine kinase [Paracoccus marinaquae]|uniref:histidine kinase n=1 Tax=Paracoccus marinaquae TaxID=2841926 RepID=A0ABS6AJJ5_9RHOB|nr:HAMP domain-containing sensor histidine kinase [Paracoccus marinaquae]MBU3030765.1 HAMP domain-containing histidine kinase [Paracoccus marinaquae]